MALVSVIIPLYKSEKFIEATLQSLFEQTHTDLEIICVDDGSPDKTGEIVQKLAKKDPRIRYLLHPKNTGAPSFGRNTGLQIAEGEFVTFLDHDDTFLPNKLTRLLEVMETEKVDFICSNIYLVNNSTDKIDFPAWGKVTGDPKKYFAKRLLEGNFVPPNSTLIRRCVFAEVGYFDPNLRGVDDFDMWYRIARRFPSTVLNEPLATWRYMNTESISANDLLMMEDERHFYQKIVDNEGWTETEKTIAKQGVKNNYRFMANRHLVERQYQGAVQHYKKAGLPGVALATTVAPSLLRSLYLWRQKRRARFQPLDLNFSE